MTRAGARTAADRRRDPARRSRADSAIRWCPRRHVLDVSAEGRTTRVPDVATIRAGVVSAGADRGGGARRQCAADGARARRAEEGGHRRPRHRHRDGRAQPAISLRRQPAAGHHRLSGDQHRASASATSRRRAAILDALVAPGANQIDGPDLSIDQPDAALDEARTDALKRARARAELYARAAGLRVARIVSIAEAGENRGGPRPPMVYARAQTADAEDADRGGRDRTVTVTLAVRFLLRVDEKGPRRLPGAGLPSILSVDPP